MIRLIYNNKAFRILNEFQISQNNKEVTFNDIKIDFTGYTLADMPLKFQEIQIKQCKDNQDILTQGDVLFFGYVDTIELGKMKMSVESRELIITLLSPLKLTTVRCSTLIGTYLLSDAIEKIFEPLVNDGFIISEINVPNSQILLSYIMKPIETIMNDLCQKKNLFWTIDMHKQIKINSLDYLFGSNLKKNITSTYEEEGFLGINPSIEATDYANVINLKNVRLIYSDSSTVNGNELIEYGGFPFLNLPKNIKTGDTIEFNFPVSISQNIGKQLFEEKDDSYYELIILLEIVADNFHLIIAYNKQTDSIQTNIIGGTISYSNQDGNEGTIVLQTDSFFSNLITGFKWNGNNTTVTSIYSESILRYITMKFMYSAEIEKLKGLISKTGQIEKTIDLNETWFTLPELTNYARSLLTENTNNINNIVLEYDKNPNLQIGDLIKIDLPSFYTQGIFAVTGIQYSYNNKYNQNWKIIVQSSNLITSYIDIFRPTQTQETDGQENSLVISEFIEEMINEKHIIEEVQDEN